MKQDFERIYPTEGSVAFPSHPWPYPLPLTPTISSKQLMLRLSWALTVAHEDFPSDGSDGAAFMS